ncbi:MAG: ACP S-malonyltransferase [Thermovirgaceae bacterium]
MSYAMVFPGQGSQEVGMGRALTKRFETARSVFREADEALGFNLGKLILEGPEEELKKTAFAQPAILTVSIAVFSVIQNELGFNPKPAYAAGHSLGEYSALVAGGALSLADGVRLVHLRGRLMQEAVPLGKGTMAALIGIGRDAVRKICEELSPVGTCEAANFNAPGQIVISGETEAVEKAMELAKERGAKRAVQLKVSAPFHCRLMEPVAEKLKVAFEECHWQEPNWPIIANVSARPERKVDDIKRSLYLQTHSPILWQDTVEYLHSAGANTFAEIGPGSVLTGLIRRTVKGVSALTAGTPEEAETLVRTLSQEG